MIRRFPICGYTVASLYALDVQDSTVLKITIVQFISTIWTTHLVFECDDLTGQHIKKLDSFGVWNFGSLDMDGKSSSEQLNALAFNI